MFVFVICCDRKWMQLLQKKNWVTSKRGTNPKTILFGTGTDTETDEECDWQPTQVNPEGGGTEDDEMEEDPSDETAERVIRCGLF